MTDKELKILQEWEMLLRNISDFVQVGKINGIKFEIRANEQGHNRPHLHVSTASASLSVAIDNGEVLASSGKISTSQMKMATKWINDNRDLIVSKWNDFSNGIEIPID